ncbi:hypothetical protein TW95_gp1103 [Pandoravirus inopinatum]|uniref:Uncharacterized protein n=1 Tax=Pandoravirus inopinatum TaxID=1605721 RepID=A0A0B5JDM6_9VIRU|nr:hypothetical protein TW95_gp1103 [Pandoravirus inopinatum]AJF97837.1 hypothetical protein [Pandoravirus inopinatum]
MSDLLSSKAKPAGQWVWARGFFLVHLLLLFFFCRRWGSRLRARPLAIFSWTGDKKDKGLEKRAPEPDCLKKRGRQKCVYKRNNEKNNKNRRAWQQGGQRSQSLCLPAARPFAPGGGTASVFGF